MCTECAQNPAGLYAIGKQALFYRLSDFEKAVLQWGQKIERQVLLCHRQGEYRPQVEFLRERVWRTFQLCISPTLSKGVYNIAI